MSADAVGAAADDLRLAARHRAAQPLARRTATSRSSSPARSSGAASRPARRRAPRARRAARRRRAAGDVGRARAAARRRLRRQGARRGACSARCASTGRPRRRSAAVPASRDAAPRSSRGDAVLGIFGELHPQVAARWDFDEPVAVLAIDLGKAVAAAPGAGDVRRPHDVPGAAPGPRRDRLRRRPRGAGAGSRARRRAASCSTRVAVFDAYRGEQVGAGRVSLALHLEFRAPDRTLTDEDVAPVRERDRRRAARRARR